MPIFFGCDCIYCIYGVKINNHKDFCCCKNWHLNIQIYSFILLYFVIYFLHYIFKLVCLIFLCLFIILIQFNDPSKESHFFKPELRWRLCFTGFWPWLFASMKRANKKKTILKTLLIGLFQILICLFAFSYIYILLFYFIFSFFLLPCSWTEGYLKKAFIEEK